MIYELCYCWYLNNDIKIWFFICGFFGYFLIGVEIIEFKFVY